MMEVVSSFEQQSFSGIFLRRQLKEERLHCDIVCSATFLYRAFTVCNLSFLLFYKIWRQQVILFIFI